MILTESGLVLHDLDARLDYTWSWSEIAPGNTRAWLDEGETITAFEVTVTGQVVTDGTTETAGVVRAWVKAAPGAVEGAASVTCHIVTSEGREDDRSIGLLLTQR